MSEEFGIYLKNMKLRVTNEPKQHGNMIKIPCSMGFKQKDGTWVNEWIDVLYKDCNPEPEIKRGDTITVNGRMSLSGYNGKKSWSVWAELDSPPF